MATRHFSNNRLADLEQQLSCLAMQFRSTRNPEEQLQLAREYERTVTSLIETRIWRNVPPPEDQLPDDWMPQQFFEYWSPQAG